MEEQIYTNPLKYHEYVNGKPTTQDAKTKYDSMSGKSSGSDASSHFDNNDGYATPSQWNDGSEEPQEKSAESESDMEFRVVESPVSATPGEYIYAVVNRKSRSSNFFSTIDTKAEILYSEIGKNIDGPGLNEIVPVDAYSHSEVYESLDDDKTPVSMDYLNANQNKKPLETNSNSIDNKANTAAAIGTVGNGSSSHSGSSYKFRAVFLGSMVVNVTELKANKYDYLMECIKSVAGQTTEDTRRTLTREISRDTSFKSPQKTGEITLSTHRGMNVVIVLEEGCMKVKEKKTGALRLEVPFKMIRVWAHGKGSTSREFAVVSQDQKVKNNLCRVFLCETPAKIVATAFNDACLGLTKNLEKKSEREQKSETAKVENIKKSSSNDSLKTLASTKTTRSDGGQPLEATLKDCTECQYLGMMEIKKSTGTKILEHAIDLVYTYVSKECWQNGKLCTTPTGVFFISKGSTRLSCPLASISFVGISLKYNTLIGIIVSKNRGIFAHVFSMNADRLHWFESMKFVSKLHSSKFDKSSTATLLKKSKAQKT